MIAHAVYPFVFVMALIGSVVAITGQLQFWLLYLFSPAMLLIALLCGLGPLIPVGWVPGWGVGMPLLVSALLLDAGALWVHSRASDVQRRRLRRRAGGPTSELPALALWDRVRNIPADPTRYRIDENLQRMEREVIPRAIAPGRYRLVEKPASVERVHEALCDDQYHIVHFLGHGEMDNVDRGYTPRGYTRRGHLRFVSDEGAPQKVTGERLQHLLLDAAPGVQLIVLNTCYGGSTAVGNVALELIHSGLPYVVAMQEEITQDAAKSFIQTFYAELQKGRSIEYAVAIGRFAIAADMPGAIDWCLPALYTNVGVPEQPVALKMSDRLWQWFSQPDAPRQLGRAVWGIGALHLAVGLLLLLSGASPPLPDPRFMIWITGGLAVAPPLLSLGAQLWGVLEVPSTWRFSERTAVAVRLLAGASVGLGMASVGVWIGLILLAGLGFWGLLSSAVQFVVLGVAFAFSVVFSFSQAVGHVRAFISDACVERPAFQGDELAVVVAGYGLLLAPLIGLKFAPVLIGPPQGNVIVGLILLAAGSRIDTRSDFV